MLQGLDSNKGKISRDRDTRQYVEIRIFSYKSPL